MHWKDYIRSGSVLFSWTWKIFINLVIYDFFSFFDKTSIMAASTKSSAMSEVVFFICICNYFVFVIHKTKKHLVTTIVTCFCLSFSKHESYKSLYGPCKASAKKIKAVLFDEIARVLSVAVGTAEVYTIDDYSFRVSFTFQTQRFSFNYNIS